jgi:hypothetical protein
LAQQALAPDLAFGLLSPQGYFLEKSSYNDLVYFAQSAKPVKRRPLDGSIKTIMNRRKKAVLIYKRK